MAEPCGCEKKIEAEQIDDDLDARRVATETAEAYQKYWNCPGLAARQEPDSQPQDTVAQGRLRSVRRLTGAACKTCPNWYLAQPAVHAAVEAYDFLVEGGLETRYGRDHPLSIVQVATIVRSGIAMRRADDEERRRKKIERDQK